MLVDLERTLTQKLQSSVTTHSIRTDVAAFTLDRLNEIFQAESEKETETFDTLKYGGVHYQIGEFVMVTNSITDTDVKMIGQITKLYTDKSGAPSFEALRWYVILRDV